MQSYLGFNGLQAKWFLGQMNWFEHTGVLLNISNLMVDLTKAARLTVSNSAVEVKGTVVATSRPGFVPKGREKGQGPKGRPKVTRGAGVPKAMTMPQW